MNASSVVEKIDVPPSGEAEPRAHRTASLTPVPSPPHGSTVPVPIAEEAWWRPVLHAIGERIKRRAVPLAFVVLVHGVLLGLALKNWRYAPPVVPPTPIQVVMITQDVEVERPAPVLVPDLTMEQPRVDMPAPIVQFDVEPAPTAITIAAQPTPTVSATSVAAAPAVAAPRFDADYLNNPAPTYPAISRRIGEHGTVTLRVRVTMEGAAAEVRIEHSSGAERLDAAAVDAVRRWRFVPARRGPEAIEAWVLVPIEFELTRNS